MGFCHGSYDAEANEHKERKLQKLLWSVVGVLWIIVLVITHLSFDIILSLQMKTAQLEDDLILLNQTFREHSSLALVENRIETIQILNKKTTFTGNVESVHFVNLQRVAETNKDGSINYWKGIEAYSKPNHLQNYVDYSMNTDGNKVRIITSGLYMVYAQLAFELSNNEMATMEVFVDRQGRQGSSERQPVSSCTVGINLDSGIDEKSCFTSATIYLGRDDQIWVANKYPQIYVNGDIDRSFFGLVKF